VSTNRTVVDLVAGEPVPRAELPKRREHLVLEALPALEVGLTAVEIGQELANERTDGGAQFGGANPRTPILVLVQ
jgi:hypothetical protein